MQYLRADTLKMVRIGPAVDITDGYTNLATLAISTADYAYMLHGDSVEVDISANTWAAVTSVTGFYDLTLTAAQLTTEGPMTIAIYDVSLCLPIRQDFHVLNANVYDALFAAAATDYLDVNTIQVGGTTQTANDNGADINAILTDTAEIGAAGAGLTALATQTSVNTIDGIVDAILVDTAEIGAAGAGLTALSTQTSVNTIDGIVDNILVDTAEIGTAGAGLTESGGTGDQLTALATQASVNVIDGIVDLILADTNELQTDWTNGGRLDLLLDSVITNIAALNNISAADVNAQMLDVLNVDTFAEPGSVPAATATLVAKLGWLAALARNKITQNATTQTLRNDADAADVATATVSDDGTTTTRGEWT